MKSKILCLFAGAAAASNVETVKKSKWMMWTIASIVLLSTIIGALVGAYLAMLFMNHNETSGTTGEFK